MTVLDVVSHISRFILSNRDKDMRDEFAKAEPLRQELVDTKLPHILRAFIVHQLFSARDRVVEINNNYVHAVEMYKAETDRIWLDRGDYSDKEWEKRLKWITPEYPADPRLQLDVVLSKVSAAIVYMLTPLPVVIDPLDMLFTSSFADLAGVTQEEMNEKLPPAEIGAPPDHWKSLNTIKLSWYPYTDLRFEGMHVVGKQGAGKTQLLQHLILNDLVSDEKRSVFVMDSQGEMIPKLYTRAPDNIVLIRPQDDIGLNVFDLFVQGEAAAEMIYYVLSFLDADTTAKQGGYLSYCIRLVCAAKGTLLTLRNLIKAPSIPADLTKFIPDLSPLGQEFMRTEFEDKKYKATKEEILWRLDALLEDPVIYRIFTAEKTTINLHEALDAGKLVLIDTEKTWKNCSFFGRFWIAYLRLATFERMHKTERTPTFAYIDEFQDYIGDDSIVENLIDQARKFKLGLILSHQRMEQLPPKLRSAVMNCAIRFANVEPADARSLAESMRVGFQFLAQQPKLSFAAYVRGMTSRAVTVPITAGLLESMKEVRAMPSTVKVKVVYRDSTEATAAKPNAKKPTSPKPPHDDSSSDID